MKTRHFLDLLFFLSLAGASTFYSLHNKPYFFLLIATVAIATMGPIPAEETARVEVARPADGPLPAS